MKRIFLFVLDSFGIGGMPDCEAFGDKNVNTLASCATSAELKIPNMIAAGLGNADGVAEALIMHDLALTQILDGIADVGIINKTKYIVIRRACLLLCYYHVFATTLSVALRCHLSSRARLFYPR